MAKKKVMWHCYTDNKEWGRFYIGKADTRREAIDMGNRANKGKFVVEPHRVWK